jgi:uncharacterized membrane protein
MNQRTEGAKAGVKRTVSLEVALSATCAVLYAMGSYLTAYISSPWGSGQFRPAVVIPAIFAALFGPFVGGIGAALGTLIADSVKHGELYVRSLVSAVPGNFIGFYLFGLLMKRRFSWENFVKTSQVTLLISNVIVAFLYVYYRVFVDVSYPVAFADAWIYIALGLVAWWYVTMLPFVLLLGPPLIRAVASAFPGFVSEHVRSSNVGSEVLRRSFSVALIIPGLIMLLIGITTMVVDPNQLLSLNIAANPLILTGMQAMFIVGAVILLALGIIILATGKLIVRGK